jgi:hypothetical protein
LGEQYRTMNYNRKRRYNPYVVLFRYRVTQ